MLLALFLVCLVALVLGTVLLFALALPARFASRGAALALLAATTYTAGYTASRIWALRAHDVHAAVGLLLVTGVVVIVVARAWNPIGQVFFGTFLASALAYLVFGAVTTFGPGLSPIARVASFGLLLLELAALALAASYTCESCDAICRVRHSRPPARFDPVYWPMVSLHVAAYNEPPEMLIATIRSLERIDYPNFEIVVIDNNTKDAETWQPVRDYCRDRPLVTFVHVDPWPGFKSGALNLALAEHTDPRAEIIGVVDADYEIDPQWLRETVGYFAEDRVAFVQTPQDYREYKTDRYLRACYDAYRYFFAVTMPFRNERNSIIFAGTMGLLRRSTLQQVGGWSEWCITEDAELSLRMLAAGYEGVFVPKSYGHGIMPLTFATLKSQRFRWCFGGMQILRLHWRELMPWSRNPDNRLTRAQRIDYLVSNLQWTNDLVYLGFTVALLASAFILYRDGPVGLRPLYGAAVLLPSALVVSGIVRALWALRIKTGISWGRAMLAFVNWLALSWTVALACLQGLTRSHGTFLRTPKTGEHSQFLSALWAARAETFWMLALWGAAAAAILNRRGTPFFLALLAWQGAVYFAAPYMSWLNQHTQLTPELELRRRTELRRERVADVTRYTAGTAATTAILVGVFTVVAAGGSNPGHPRNPFRAAHTPARGLRAREQRTPATTRPQSTNPNGSPASTNSSGAPRPIAAPGGGPGVRPQSGGAGPPATTPTTTPGSAPVATTTSSTPASTPPTTGPPAPTTTTPPTPTTTTVGGASTTTPTAPHAP